MKYNVKCCGLTPLCLESGGPQERRNEAADMPKLWFDPYFDSTAMSKKRRTGFPALQKSQSRLSSLKPCAVP